MALDDAEKAKIRRWLGYPDPSVNVSDPQWAIEANMDEVSAAGETEIDSILTRLDAIWTQGGSILARAGLKRVEDIEFYGGGDANEALGLAGNELADMLANLLGVAVLHYPFASRRMCGGIAQRGA